MHKFETHIINSLDLFTRLQNYVDKLQPEYMVLDVETDSLIEKKANLYGIGLCFTDSKAFYISTKNPDGTDVWTKSELNSIKNWIDTLAKKTKIIGHNIIYDILVLENTIGLQLTDHIYSDTILQKHILDEERPFGLKDIAVKYLGDWADKAQTELKEAVLAAGGEWKKEQKDMYLAPTEILGKYCCWDVMLTFLLFNKFEEQIKEDNLYNLFYLEETMPLYKEVTINMKRLGFPVDVAHFQRLLKEIQLDINTLQDTIYKEIKDEITDFEQQILDKECPIKAKGNFPKILAEILQIPLPTDKKTNKVTLSKKALEDQMKALGSEFHFFYEWLIEKNDNVNLDDFSDNIKLLYSKSEDPLRLAQERMYFSKATNIDKKYVFNLKSGDHLVELIINKWGYPVKDRTEKTQKPKIDADYLEFIEDDNIIVQKLLQFKKLEKIKSTYIEGILKRQVDGIIYTDMLQYGTTSGRFSSRNPNLQNLPKPQEISGKKDILTKYVNGIRAGFVAEAGYKIVDADYSALEPRCFSQVSRDPKLMDVWFKGEDLYSRIAIDVFNLKDVSAHPDDSNYLKKVNPEFRQKAKVFCLAVVYGAEESRISKALKVDYNEAAKIIHAYLKAYPGLKRYMSKCNYRAKSKGEMVSEFGRIRHVPKAQSLYVLYGNNVLDYKHAKKKQLLQERRELKNALNNAKNFPIQSLAGHIINRAMIAISRRFRAANMKSYIGLMVHDQVCCVVPNEELNQAVEIVRDCMENTTKLDIPLIAEPMIANNLRDSH